MNGHAGYKDTFLIGKTTVYLQDLRDQFKHQQWFELSDPETDRPSNARIHLSLQWVYSQSQFLNDYAKRLENQIEEQKVDYEDYMEQLNTLRRLAPVLGNQSVPMNQSRPVQPYREDHIKPPTQVFSAVEGLNGHKVHINPSVGFSEVGFGGLNINKIGQEIHKNVAIWGRESMAGVRYSSLPEDKMSALYYAMGAWAAFSFVSTFNRPSFLDVRL